ncbi:dienelactone hydrolase family protein [Phenylobacterium sp.]|uniref:dienelactone hydrolase family protein n=1 Tax=Phenylobacterium sp. TaxID=1871053 RepID=UPI002628A214|nr:dienelactone hydrolase family protein [Phenylobacterium sp.]
MCDDDIHQGLTPDVAVTRRTLGVSAAAAAALAAASAHAAAVEVAEKDVAVKTPDGTCDAVLFTPAGKGPYPGVLIWTDILGLRPVFREMGKRLASSGYVVLTPNPFYRSAKAPVVDAGFNFSDPAQRKKVFDMRGAMTWDGIDKDIVAYTGYLQAAPKVNRKVKLGVQGYCMGGPLMMRTAATAADRIGAGASFHGGTLVTKDANSPHLWVPKMKGQFYIAEADNDDKSNPEAKTIVQSAFEAAHVPARLEVYAGAMHGWCVPGSQVYNAPAAEKAWGELLALYGKALA